MGWNPWGGLVFIVCFNNLLKETAEKDRLVVDSNALEDAAQDREQWRERWVLGLQAGHYTALLKLVVSMYIRRLGTCTYDFMDERPAVLNKVGQTQVFSRSQPFTKLFFRIEYIVRTCGHDRREAISAGTMSIYSWANIDQVTFDRRSNRPDRECIDRAINLGRGIVKAARWIVNLKLHMQQFRMVRLT